MSGPLEPAMRKDMGVLSMKVRCIFEDLGYVFEADENDTVDEWRLHR